jgi:hypothetical protein
MKKIESLERLKAHRESHASSAGQRGWQSGQSGNPKGRPIGSRNKKNVIAEEFAKDGSRIARVVIDAALEGDLQAANLVLQRLSPQLRARAEKVTFYLTPDAPLTTQAEQVLAAISNGDIDPQTGHLLIGCITALAGLKQVDDLEQRLSALEGGNENG